MNLRELDVKMRAFEAYDNDVVPRGLYVVARLDGRGFGRLAREVFGFQGPYDTCYRDHMVATTQELMRSGLHVLYAYTQSDEISLLCHPDDTSFGRRMRKYHSVLAGIASSAFSLQVGSLATFDCRISRLPDPDRAIDYFHWRARDAQRNALTSHCWHAMARAGLARQDISAALHGLTSKAKRKLLAREHGIDFNSLPGWQKRGVGLYWNTYDKELEDSETGAVRTVQRQRIEVDQELPSRSDYARFLRQLLQPEI